MMILFDIRNYRKRRRHPKEIPTDRKVELDQMLDRISVRLLDKMTSLRLVEESFFQHLPVTHVSDGTHRGRPPSV